MKSDWYIVWAWVVGDLKLVWIDWRPVMQKGVLPDRHWKGCTRMYDRGRLDTHSSCLASEYLSKGQATLAKVLRLSKVMS